MGDKDHGPRHMGGVWLVPRIDYTLSYHNLAEVPCLLLGTTHGQVSSSQYFAYIALESYRAMGKSMHVLEDFSSFLEGHGVAIPGCVRRS